MTLHFDGGKMTRKVIKVGPVTLGDGQPKLCVPICAPGIPAMLADIKSATALPLSLLEWRMDFYFGAPSEALPYFAGEKGCIPLICNLRSVAQGGCAILHDEDYQRIFLNLLDTGLCEIVELELCRGGRILWPIIKKAKEKQVPIILSKYDTTGTPTKTELLKTIDTMIALSCDIPKIVVKANTPKDTLTLMEASLSAYERYGLVIAIAKGRYGKISLVSGAYFGSCITYASATNETSNSQINAEDLAAMISDISMTMPLPY